MDIAAFFWGIFFIFLKISEKFLFLRSRFSAQNLAGLRKNAKKRCSYFKMKIIGLKRQVMGIFNSLACLLVVFSCIEIASAAQAADTALDTGNAAQAAGNGFSDSANTSSKKQKKRSKTVMEVFNKITDISIETPEKSSESQDEDFDPEKERALKIKENFSLYKRAFRIFRFIFENLSLAPSYYDDPKNENVMFDNLAVLKKRLLVSPYAKRSWKDVKTEYRVTRKLLTFNHFKPIYENEIFLVKRLFLKRPVPRVFDPNSKDSDIVQLIKCTAAWRDGLTKPISNWYIRNKEREEFGALARLFAIEREAKEMNDFIEIKRAAQKKAQRVVEILKLKI